MTPSSCESSSSKFEKDINITFENVCYTTKVGLFRRNEKQVLRNLSGEFHARELSAIMGPSGSGKSSLLDILSGYNTSRNIRGAIKVNGQLRDQKAFRHMSSYIMQDHLLHPLLTVQEAMKFSVNLKIGNEMSSEEKLKRISDALESLGLSDSINTMTKCLSGGQQKRLSIALELVDDPQVMFFDEPSSGLDSVSTTQCLKLLKDLAAEGRTIICTIHQPSALIFETFDHIYAIAEGKCIYQGSHSNVVHFLSQLDLPCPPFHNPADFLLEVATGKDTDEYGYGYQNDRLVQKIDNGRNRQFCSEPRSPLPLDRSQPIPLIRPVIAAETNPISLCIKNLRFNIFDPRTYCEKSDLYSTSFLRQFYYLYIRTILLIIRNPSLSGMRIGIHIAVAFCIGILYFQIGDSAKNSMNNFRFIFYTVMFLMFTAFSSLQTTFPSELPVIKREHFNRWYSFSAYYVSQAAADLPFQIFCIVSYILITYFLTNQPLEWSRFVAFFVINLLCSFVGQSLGLVVSSLFSVKWGCILGNFFICPFLVFSGFFIQMKHAHKALHWLFHISFLKYALEGSVYSIFGFNRKIECDSDENIPVCRYSRPNQLIRDLGMQDCAIDSNSTKTCDQIMTEGQYNGFWKVICVLIIFIVVFRLIAFCIMRYRLKH